MIGEPVLLTPVSGEEHPEDTGEGTGKDDDTLDGAGKEAEETVS